MQCSLLGAASQRPRQGFAGSRAIAAAGSNCCGGVKRQQQSNLLNSKLGTESGSIHCNLCNQAVRGADWTKHVAQPSPHDSALMLRKAERLRKADLARQLLVSRRCLSQVDAALIQAGGISRPEELMPLISAAATSTAVVAAAGGGGKHVSEAAPPASDCPTEADMRRLPYSAGRKILGRSRGFVPGVGLLSRFGRSDRVAALHLARTVATRGNEAESNNKNLAVADKGERRARHINNIFRIPYDDAIAMEAESGRKIVGMEQSSANSSKNTLDDDNARTADNEDFEESARLTRRRRTGRTVGIVGADEAAAEEEAMKPSKPPPPHRPLAGSPMSVSGRQVQLIRRMSTVEMVVHNEDGEAEEVEIDVVEGEVEGSSGHRGGGSSGGRRSTISDRINRRRNSELAADIIRLSAAHRRREFAQLLDEHQAIIQELEGQSAAGGGGGIGGKRGPSSPSGHSSLQRAPHVGTIQEGSVDLVDKGKENIDSA